MFLTGFVRFRLFSKMFFVLWQISVLVSSRQMNRCRFVRLICHIWLVIVEEQHDVCHYSVSVKPSCGRWLLFHPIILKPALLSDAPVITAELKPVMKLYSCGADAVFFQGSSWLYSSSVREEQVCFVSFNEVSFWETARNNLPPDLVRLQWMSAVFMVMRWVCSAEVWRAWEHRRLTQAETQLFSSHHCQNHFSYYESRTLVFHVRRWFFTLLFISEIFKWI